MVSTAAQSERLYEEAFASGAGQARVEDGARLAVFATGPCSFFFHLPSGQLAPVFAYLPDDTRHAEARASTG